ncbi:Uncharacterised protein [Chromobacterium vaccinii]|nr:Uncharacterised protein [Chromobacterium vaccinii]
MSRHRQLHAQYVTNNRGYIRGYKINEKFKFVNYQQYNYKFNKLLTREDIVNAGI